MLNKSGKQWWDRNCIKKIGKISKQNKVKKDKEIKQKTGSNDDYMNAVKRSEKKRKSHWLTLTFATIWDIVCGCVHYTYQPCYRVD